MDRDEVFIFQPPWWGQSDKVGNELFRAIWSWSLMCGSDSRWLLQVLKNSNLNNDPGETPLRGYRFRAAYEMEFKNGLFYDTDSLTVGASGHYGALTAASGGWSIVETYGAGTRPLFTNQAAKTLDVVLPTGTKALYLLFKPIGNTVARPIGNSLVGDTDGLGALVYPTNLETADIAGSPFLDLYGSDVEYALTKFAKVAEWTGAGSTAGAVYRLTTISTDGMVFMGAIAVGATASNPADGVPDIATIRTVATPGWYQGYILSLDPVGDNSDQRFWGFGHYLTTNGDVISSNVTAYAQTITHGLQNAAFVPADDARAEQLSTVLQIKTVGTLTVDDTGANDIAAHEEVWQFVPGGHTCHGRDTCNADAVGWYLTSTAKGGYVGLTEFGAAAGSWYQIPAYHGEAAEPILGAGGFDDSATDPVRASEVIVGGPQFDILTAVASFQEGTELAIKRMIGGTFKVYKGLCNHPDDGAPIALANGQVIWGLTRHMYGMPGAFSKLRARR